MPLKDLKKMKQNVKFSLKANNMDFIKTFNTLSQTNEGGAGGQRTYKDFLVFLADFLGCARPSNYNAGWVLHHRDGDHFNNSQFDNLVLMNESHHISFHKQISKDADKATMKDFLENGTTKDGAKFEYWLIGEEIYKRINTVQTEPDIDKIIKEV